MRVLYVLLGWLPSLLSPGFDHHCPYTSTCVGQRNRKPFLIFVLASTLQLLVVFAACAMRLVDGAARRYSSALRGEGGAEAGNRHVYSWLLQACVQSAVDQPLNSCCCAVLSLLLVKLLPFCQVPISSTSLITLPIYLPP